MPGRKLRDRNFFNQPVECNSNDQDLGFKMSVEECAAACQNMNGCKYFIYGIETKAGRCYWEYTTKEDCSDDEWMDDFYNFYRLGMCPPS